MNLIVIAGMPATGKTTIANQIRDIFGFPVFEKDNLKEALFDVIGFECYAEKRKLDKAATETLLKVVESQLQAGNSSIIVNNFDTEENAKLNSLVEKYKPNCLTIFVNGEEKVLYKRYVERDKKHERHPGHIVQDHYPLHKGDSPDYTMTPEEFNQKFVQRGMDKFRIPGTRLDVDATDFNRMDIKKIIEFIKENI